MGEGETATPLADVPHMLSHNLQAVYECTVPLPNRISCTIEGYDNVLGSHLSVVILIQLSCIVVLVARLFLHNPGF